MILRTSMRYAAAAVLLVAVCLWALPGCGNGDDNGDNGGRTTKTGNGEMTITSPAFGDGEAIPERFSYPKDDKSPALEFGCVPAEAKELALILDDPDADGYVHWVVYGIPPTAEGLPEAVPTGPNVANPAGAKQGENTMASPSYMGPSPPAGETHRYHFTLYALDTKLDLTGRVKGETLIEAMKGHVIAKAVLVGTFKQ